MTRVQIELSTYENVYVSCPKCRRALTLNRVSDLETVWRIAGMEVTCTHPGCIEKFWIHTDVINPAYDLLVMDSSHLMQEKRYSACFVQLATALEAMLRLYLQVEMISRPYGAAKGAASNEALNNALGELQKRTRWLGYERLRDTAIKHAFNLGEIPKFSSVVASIRKLDTKRGCPTDDELRMVAPEELSEFLLLLKALEVNKIRNKVVHQCYRPHRSEAQEALDQVSELMARVDDVFGILPGDDLDAYIYLDQGHLGRVPVST